MKLTDAERQKKYREKRKALDLKLVRIWVPKDRVQEVKFLVVRFLEEKSMDKNFCD